MVVECGTTADRPGSEVAMDVVGGRAGPRVPKGPGGPAAVVVVCMRHVVEAATSGREAGIAVMGSVVVGVGPPWTCGWA